jgi:hypothetical protein
MLFLRENLFYAYLSFFKFFCIFFISLELKLQHLLNRLNEITDLKSASNGVIKSEKYSLEGGHLKEIFLYKVKQNAYLQG